MAVFEDSSEHGSALASVTSSHMVSLQQRIHLQLFLLGLFLRELGLQRVKSLRPDEHQETFLIRALL
jgi:hypothetical protein